MHVACAPVVFSLCVSFIALMKSIRSALWPFAHNLPYPLFLLLYW